LARRILLADDSVTAQNMGRRILSDAGYEVITVNNGSAALKKATEQKPDVIVLDVYMPGYGGLEVCQRLKEMSDTARIPILLTVGKLEPFKPEEARRVRADAFIVKPFEATELLAALTKLEDRIVPSSDGPKGKKFSGDAGRSEEDTGWKNRLIIPPGGKGRTPDAAEADDFGQSEDSAKKLAKKDEKPAAIAKTEETVKAAAEEKVVSIDTKIANDTKIAKAESTTESAPAESKIAEPAKVEPVNEVAKAESESKPKDVAPVTEVKADNPVVAAEIAVAKAEVPAAVSATAVTETYSGTRWVAEEVAASADEKSFALDREMEKSFAAAAAFDAGQMFAAEKREEAKAKAVSIEAAAKEIPVSEPVPAPVAESKVEEAKIEEVKVEESKVEELKTTEEIKVEAAKTEETKFQSVEKREEFASPAEMPVVAPPVEAVAEDAQPQEVASTEAVAQPKGEAFAAAASAGSSVVEGVIAEAVAPVAAPVEETTNKQQLAAAWEQWQSVRESVLNSPVAEQITEVAAATLKNAAEAANTRADIEAIATAAASNPTNIAHIVDSVLAELKPKLVEEIARKLGSQKK
jgi:CheY-like chemotaxis protein